jgi:hypothetical protein
MRCDGRDRRDAMDAIYPKTCRTLAVETVAENLPNKRSRNSIFDWGYSYLAQGKNQLRGYRFWVFLVTIRPKTALPGPKSFANNRNLELYVCSMYLFIFEKSHMRYRSEIQRGFRIWSQKLHAINEYKQLQHVQYANCVCMYICVWGYENNCHSHSYSIHNFRWRDLKNGNHTGMISLDDS